MGGSFLPEAVVQVSIALLPFICYLCVYCLKRARFSFMGIPLDLLRIDFVDVLGLFAAVLASGCISTLAMSAASISRSSDKLSSAWEAILGLSLLEVLCELFSAASLCLEIRHVPWCVALGLVVHLALVTLYCIVYKRSRDGGRTLPDATTLLVYVSVLVFLSLFVWGDRYARSGDFGVDSAGVIDIAYLDGGLSIAKETREIDGVNRLVDGYVIRESEGVSLETRHFVFAE